MTADALLDALRSPPPHSQARAAVVQEISKAIVQAQQFDTEAGFRLETPDELTDLASFADALLAHDFRAHPGVLRSAKALKDALVGIKVYGSPRGAALGGGWHEHHLGLQRRRAGDEHLPARPLLRGQWDWRSPYYLDINPDPTSRACSRTSSTS